MDIPTKMAWFIMTSEWSICRSSHAPWRCSPLSGICGRICFACLHRCWGPEDSPTRRMVVFLRRANSIPEARYLRKENETGHKATVHDSLATFASQFWSGVLKTDFETYRCDQKPSIWAWFQMSLVGTWAWHFGSFFFIERSRGQSVYCGIDFQWRFSNVRRVWWGWGRAAAGGRCDVMITWGSL